MAERNTPIRVLVVDDEPEIRDAYKQILCDAEVDLEMTGFHELRSRLFRKDPAEALRQRAAAARLTSFDVTFCEQAPQAVAAVKERLARNEPFADPAVGVTGATVLGRRPRSASSIRRSKSSSVPPTRTPTPSRSAVSRRPRRSSRICRSRFIPMKCAR